MKIKKCKYESPLLEAKDAPYAECDIAGSQIRVQEGDIETWGEGNSEWFN